ncbi:MAG: DnaJ domain-containing protein [Planctomycetes bacterium]|nr:DnaJ domain-containing protein [Planctomycetota bacterium]
MKDYYEVLGVSPQATEKDVKERFRFLSHAYHPDKFATSSQREQAEELFKLKSEAYNVLSVKEKRNLYDKEYNKKDNGKSFNSSKANNNVVDLDSSTSNIKDLKSLKKMYIIGGGILGIFIIAGIIMNLSSSSRSTKVGSVPVPTLAALDYAKNDFPGFQDVLSINRSDFDSEIIFRQRQQQAVSTFNNEVSQLNPDYQAATATFNLGDFDAKSSKLSLSINWRLWANQLDREGYIIIPIDKAKTLMKDGRQKPIYAYLDIVEDSLKINKIALIGLGEEMTVSFWPAGTVKHDPTSNL